MSAFIQDWRFDELPKKIRKEISRFASPKAHHQIPQYGMTVRELLPKADPENLKTAAAHVRKHDPEASKKLVNLRTRRGDKFILINNDRIVDGHHFLASARHGGVSSSLNVLDLTPTRFQFSASVAKDRYSKQIRENEENRKESNYARSAIAGAALGAVLRKKGKLTHAAGAGAAAGIAAQAAVRAVNAGSQDQYGDRPLESKRTEKLPWQAAGVAAGVLGARKLARAAKSSRFLRKFSIAGEASEGISSAAEKLGSFLKSRGIKRVHLLNGAALTGGIAAADAATSALDPKDGESRISAAGSGLAKGAVYGGILAGAEPALKSVLKKKKFAAKHDLRQFAAPHVVVKRAAGFVTDATRAAKGEENVDNRGRRRKNEWEKQWVRNAALGAAVTGATLAGKRYLGARPKLRSALQKSMRGTYTPPPNASLTGKTLGAVSKVSAKVQQTLAPKKLRIVREHGLAAREKITRFDSSAPDWDVRDQRGRSARVFAPGARPRQRREKRWHERVDNIRRTAVIGALAAGALGAAVGHRIGKGAATTGAKTAAAKAAPKSWAKPGYKTKKVTVVGKQAFRRATQ